ncbi:hypothetical protein BST95_07765 [Halioglobus japonicus]|uniref:Uncharacterized protein n=1 Tax=Halioglobus japonicus TaxID=930805 RepID=A0AAP8SNI8_9GAMM|nr:hypothetical protein [Halioglobus japonicus]AQA18151.1 hypothetical protein BST95_07765 [Halioglobus japonicus]PLW86148.1 hypothetical protein C0029_06805 [Halioglobus japonicus]GHD14196.1 hypothetical protein GCM10007052_17670 [Halioglobus japonicus]
MDDPVVTAVLFIFTCGGYHFRTIWRMHKQAKRQGDQESLGRTWLRHWYRPEVVKTSFKCATRSLAVYLGIEIAEDERDKKPDTGSTQETDHY